MDSTDPLFFTCELIHVFGLRIKLPNVPQELISVGDTSDNVVLPAGFTVVSLHIVETEYIRNISLTLSIANASLLNDGVIICDNALKNNSLIKVMAGCQVCGKF